MKLPVLISAERRRYFIHLIGNGCLQALAIVGLSLLIRTSVDDQQSLILISDNSLWLNAGGFICIGLLFAWLKYREKLDSNRSAQDYIHELRVKMFASYCSCDIREINQHSQQTISSRFTNDLDDIDQWISLGLSRLIVYSVSLSVTLIALCAINYTLGLIVGLLILGTGISSLGIANMLRHIFCEARQLGKSLDNHLYERLATMGTIRAFGHVDAEKRRVKRRSFDLMQANTRRANADGLLSGITAGATIITATLVLIIGLIMLQAQLTSIGTVIASLGILQLFILPLGDLGSILESQSRARTAENRIRTFLDRHSTRLHTRVEERQGLGYLKLKDVAFFADSHDINLHINPGKTVALLGLKGAGKSTILAQLAGLLEPARGSVILGGNNVSKLRDQDIRDSIGIVCSNLPLIKDSIRNNICYRCPHASDEEINRVVDLCELNTLIDSLAYGMETRLLEGGKNLSQSDCQRIALARAIIGKPELLLLDDIDSFLGSDALVLLSRICSDYPGLIVMATENIDHIGIADQIWIIDKGELCWFGPRVNVSLSGYADMFVAGAKKSAPAKAPSLSRFITLYE